MWIVGNDQLSGTPSPTSVAAAAGVSGTGGTTTTASTIPGTPHLPSHQGSGGAGSGVHVSVPATPPLGATPPSLMMGKLQGVISLTDVLNLFARVEGLKPSDTTNARMNRRRSSSSSTTTSNSTTTERRR